MPPVDSGMVVIAFLMAKDQGSACSKKITLYAYLWQISGENVKIIQLLSGQSRWNC